MEENGRGVGQSCHVLSDKFELGRRLDRRHFDCLVLWDAGFRVAYWHDYDIGLVSPFLLCCWTVLHCCWRRVIRIRIQCERFKLNGLSCRLRGIIDLIGSPRRDLLVSLRAHDRFNS